MPQKVIYAFSYCLFALCFSVSAQQAIPLQDMSFWKITNEKNWKIAGSVSADFRKDHDMKAGKGTGVLANLPDDKNRSNLISVAEYGDLDVSFDFMMAKYSNSGFYLQGRYEVQLLDSWGRKAPAYNDCGGIFPRRRFEPREELFEGHAPLQNASLAPGLWQKMEISFRAPRFDGAGKKIANAKMVYVRLNGVTVQDNLELTGPTGGPISETETTAGPIMIQGDHGQIAFRNMVFQPVGNQPVPVSPIQYEVIYGDFREPSEFQDKPVELKGSTSQLTWEVARKENSFATRYYFDITTQQAGKYEFRMQAGGNAWLKVNGQEGLPRKWANSSTERVASLELPAGKIPVELVYYKMDGWMPPMLKLTVKSPDGSVTPLHAFSSTLAMVPPDPIYLDAKESTVFRSFIDYSEGGKFKKRIVHPVNVGHPDKVHYTYDLDNGALVQTWRGHFLNNAPMWDNRGDGSARPRGMVLPLGDAPALVTMEHLADTSDLHQSELGFKSMGYDLETDNLPVFRYRLAGVEIRDNIRIAEHKYLTRTLEMTEGSPNTPLVCRLAAGMRIEEVEKGLYSINDAAYLIRVPKEVKAQVLQKNGRSILYVPMTGSVQYEILY